MTPDPTPARRAGPGGPRPALAVALALAAALVPAAGRPAAGGDEPWRLAGELAPGPHPVGFEILETYDRTRTFRDAVDARGEPRPGERARPVQISLWYPAAPAPGRDPMRFGGYVEATAGESDFRARGAAERREVLEAFVAARARAGMSKAKLERLLETPMSAVPDAAPAAGRYPLVVVAQGFGASPWILAGLSEHLASHGYLVAASPSMGARSRLMDDGFVGLETQARDVEHLIAALHGRPGREPDRLGLVGYSFGGAAALMVAMRRGDVDALVSLDGSEALDSIAEHLRHWPFFDRSRVRGAMLRLGGAASPGLDLGLVEELRYSRRYLATFPRLRHFDFSMLGPISAFVPGFSGEVDGDPLAGHEWVCRYVRRFLDAFLGGDPGSRSFLERPPAENGAPPGLLAIERREALPAPPSESAFLDLMEEEGIEAAARLFKELRRTDPEVRVFAESTLDRHGQGLLAARRLQDAVALYRLLAEAYPDSWDAHRGLGEAYLAAGARRLALASFRRALALHPDDPLLASAVRQLEEREP